VCYFIGMSKLKEFRNKKNWSQEDLAREAGVSAFTVSRIENGQKPHGNTLRHIARALSLNPEQMAAVWAETRDGGDGGLTTVSGGE